MSAEFKGTPGPWFVRSRQVGGKIVDCFVAAKDVQGFAYDAEILGDDEYRGDVDRMLADARLIAAAPDLLQALRNADKLITQLLPGVKHIVLQDYAFLNDTLLANERAISKALKGE
jgi:hypothetical protein